MFCPNCGTKNEDAAEKCAKCGFGLSAQKPAAPKFKGTMLMQATPALRAAGSSVPPAAPSPAGPSKFKGTMVGIAPPGLEEFRQSLNEAPADPAAENPGTSAAPAAAVENPGTGAAPAAAAPSKLKGTMIGLAPPGWAEQLKAGGAPAAADPTVAEPAAAQPAPLKGTMIGVAPPQLAELQKAQEQLNSTLESPVHAPVPPGGAGENPAPSVNPLGGTLVGVSPFTTEAGEEQTSSTEKPSVEPWAATGLAAAGLTAAGLQAAHSTDSSDVPAADRTLLSQQATSGAQEEEADSFRLPAPAGLPGAAGQPKGPLFLLVGLIVAVVFVGLYLLFS